MAPEPHHCTEAWGRCEACDRWFYCGHAEPASATWPACPVCATPPVEVEHRVAEAPA